MMWLIWGTPDDLENDTVMENYGAEEIYSVVKNLMDTIWLYKHEAQQDTVHKMIQIPQPCTIRQ